MPTQPAQPPFGRLLTAMVTPFSVAGELDLDGAVSLARYLVDEQHNDGLVVNGTTGEAPTTSDSEKAELVAAVVDAVGDRARIVAGVGTFDTVHTIQLAEQAAKAGANGLLVVTPYYSKPPQTGLLQHFRAVANATDLPVMIYDIPGRAAAAVSTETMIELAGHEQIVAVKDAKGDLAGSARVIAETGLAYYSGDDAMTLPLLAVGGVGMVGTSTHFSGALTHQLIEAYLAGRTVEALRLHQQLLPIYTGIFRTQGVILVKAGLAMQGRSAGPLRLPMVEATEHEISHLRADLAAAGLG
ncbi:MAG TPA: 4-hydroxy-tetrahydrodipicolinate synthase [Jatrophihabitans sp.]|nr:4-hydroxy-tetrahydrodipicolinate synthase [Jatrophihabitans sp.]